MKNTRAIRADNEFDEVLRIWRAQYLLRNKKPPTTSQMTKYIARKLKKEGITNEDAFKI